MVGVAGLRLVQYVLPRRDGDRDVRPLAVVAVRAGDGQLPARHSQSSDPTRLHDRHLGVVPVGHTHAGPEQLSDRPGLRGAGRTPAGGGREAATVVGRLGDHEDRRFREPMDLGREQRPLPADRPVRGDGRVSLVVVLAESDPALQGPPLLVLGVAVLDADPPVAVLIIGGRSSSEGQGEPAADMDARELAPQLLFFIEAGVQEGSHRFQSPSPASYGSVRFPGSV